MFRLLAITLTLTVAFAITPSYAGASGAPQCTDPATTTSAAPKRTSCEDHAVTPTSSEQGAPDQQHEQSAPQVSVPKVLFKLNTAEDAPTILRFVTNYLAVEPTAKVAVVGYAGGIDFMLKGALDPNGKEYADQLSALAGRGVAFKVCNNTLKARNLTTAAVNPSATVVPGAVNEIIRLQTNEGYAYFQN